MDVRFRVIRKHIVFHGAVQGVGFRYRANYAAQGLGLTGWVENAWNGTVVMEVQGTEDQINKMLVTINRSVYVSIDRMEVREIPVDEEERGFHVRY